MMVTGAAMVTEQVYGRAIRALIGRSVLISRVCGVGLFLVGVLALLAQDPTSTVMGIVALVIGLLFTFVLPWRSVSASTRNARPALAGPWRYELTDQHLKITNPLASSEFPWANLTVVHDDPEFWLLGTPIKRQGVIVTKTAFSAADQRVIAARLQALGAGVGRPVPPPDAEMIRPPVPDQ